MRQQMYFGSQMSKEAGSNISGWLDRRLPFLLVVACPCLLLIYAFGGQTGEYTTYLVGGAVVIWLTNRRAKAMESNVSIAQKGQSIARFESAVRLLESDNSPIVVGAVYALHRMAVEEPEYQAPVFDVLCELIRESRKEHLGGAKRIALKLLFSQEGEKDSEMYPFKARLKEADLSNWDLSEMCLIGAALEDSNLDHANISGTDLSNADLTSASIDGLVMNDQTKMKGITLRGVKVSSMTFRSIDLSNSDMRTAGVSTTPVWVC